jgi:hypothetical protein
MYSVHWLAGLVLKKSTTMCKSFFQSLVSRSFAFLALTLFLIACSKDNSGGSNATPGAPFWKGAINSSVWEHATLLRTNGTARYFVSFSGGSMNDTANVNVSKYEGTYTLVSGTDSIYINCANAGSTVSFRLKGKMNSAQTSMSGTWIHSTGGITNTLPYAMAK